MCILFLNFAKKCREPASKYILILASNRDEFFHRPSMEADFWKEAPQVLGGRDMTLNREGGTWLGITKSGHLGMLTNFRSKVDFSNGQPKSGNELKSRGSIVSDFLLNNYNPDEYITSLINTDGPYSPFNVLLGDYKMDDGFRFFYGNNQDGSCEPLEEGIHGLSNSSINCPWTKVQMGKQKFAEIISENSNEEDLIEKLSALMHNSEINFPNDGGSRLHVPVEYAPYLSSIFVSVPNRPYGTRTTTIILVDRQHEVTFVEKTMTQPINVSDPKWTTSTFKFNLDH